MDVETTLSEIVGAENFMNDRTLPQTYPNDFSDLPAGTPDYVVRPSSAEEVSAIMRLCDENKIPMVPFSSKIHFYDAAIPKEGGPVLDISRMDKILEIDPDNRRVRFEAGVKKIGFRLIMAPWPTMSSWKGPRGCTIGGTEKRANYTAGAIREI